MTRSEVRSLATEIEEVFRTVPYPRDDRLVSAPHLGGEYAEIAAAFKGRTWSSLDLEFLRYHHASLFFLTPEAYRYFLPAYLRVSVLSYRKADLIPGSVLYSLTPPADPGPDKDEFLSRVATLSQGQKRVIRRFLEYLRDAHRGGFLRGEINRPLNRYWHRF